MISTSIVIGVATGGSVILGQALSKDTTIPVEWAVPAAIFACGMVYVVGTRIQKFVDTIKELNKELKGLPCHQHKEFLETVMRRLARIEGQLNLVPFEKLTMKEQKTSTL